MEPGPAELLLTRPCVTCLRAASVGPLLGVDKHHAQWSRPAHLSVLLRMWRESWAFDLFDTSRTLKAVIARETQAARLVGMVQRWPPYKDKSWDWLQSLAELRPQEGRSRDTRSVWRLLRSNLHSSTMWACACAALRDITLRSNDAWFLLRPLEASLNDLEFEPLHQLGLDLLRRVHEESATQAVRALIGLRLRAGLARRGAFGDAPVVADPLQSQRHLEVGFELACRGMTRWPRNGHLVGSALRLAAASLVRIPLGPRAHDGSLATFVAHVGGAAQTHPGLVKEVRSALRSIGPLALQHVYSTSSVARAALQDTVQRLVEVLERGTQCLQNWVLLTELASSGPTQLGHCMLAAGAVQSTCQVMWQGYRHMDLDEDEHAWMLGLGMRFVVVLARRIGASVVSPTIKRHQELLTLLQGMPEELRFDDPFMLPGGGIEDVEAEFLDLLSDGAQRP